MFVRHIGVGPQKIVRDRVVFCLTFSARFPTFSFPTFFRVAVILSCNWNAFKLEFFFCIAFLIVVPVVRVDALLDPVEASMAGKGLEGVEGDHLFFTDRAGTREIVGSLGWCGGSLP